MNLVANQAGNMRKGWTPCGGRPKLRAVQQVAENNDIHEYNGSRVSDDSRDPADLFAHSV